MENVKFFHPALQYTEQNKGRGYVVVPGHIIVCPVCGGHGSHVRRDIDDSRLVDNMCEDGDTESLTAYFKGAYDVPCEECGGRNVVMAPEWDFLPIWAKKAVNDWNESERQSRAIEAAERRMGA